MRVFEANRKINFVDENNVFVGYDDGQRCCEVFGYVFTREDPETIMTSLYNIKDAEFDHSVYRFDPDFYRNCDECVYFKLQHIDNPDDVIYLSLYNYHNGYYSHGFSFSVDGVVKQNGGI